MAEWTAAFINDLPDSSFAVILPGGEKDDDGKTVPRDLRKLPHHNADGELDMPHLRNALSREPQADMPEGMHEKAHAHLMAHAKAEGMADRGREFRVAADTWPGEEMTLRAEADGMTFSGYAAVFNSWSDDLGGFRERIRPGAFDKSLSQKRAVKMFWNHNTDIALGTSKSNLTLKPDDRGLLATARLPDTSAGRDMATLVRDGIVDSMSFGFQTIKDAWNDDLTERDLHEVRLFEVSPVTGWPAYPATSASVRELAESINAEPDALAEAFAILRQQDAKLSAEQSSLLTSLINARSERPVRRVFNDAERSRYAAFEAALPRPS